MTDDIDNDGTTLHESGGVGVPSWQDSYRTFRADYDRYNAGNLRMPFSELRGSLDLLIGELEAALAARPQSDGWQPVAWQYRWYDTYAQEWDEWKELVPRDTESMQERIAEIESYRYNDKKIYEVRALCALPAAAPTADDRSPRMTPTNTIPTGEVRDAQMALRLAGEVLSNCAFNLAQRNPGQFTTRDIEALDKARKQWDAAVRALSLSPAPVAETVLGEASEAEIRRVIRELRAYSPPGDQYKGAHIHGLWARELEAALTTPPPAPSSSAPAVAGETMSDYANRMRWGGAPKEDAAPTTAQGLSDAFSGMDIGQTWTKEHSLNYPQTAANIINEARAILEASRAAAKETK